MMIRRFKPEDAEKVSEIVGRNFIEINSWDYPMDEMQELLKIYNPEKLLQIASYAHTYVICNDDIIVGTGSITSYWGSKTESILLTIFVLPEYHGKGFGRMIIETLEQDELFLRASRIEIPASITACKFYEKMGYRYKNNIKTLDDEGHYKMEKIR